MVDIKLKNLINVLFAFGVLSSMDLFLEDVYFPSFWSLLAGAVIVMAFGNIFRFLSFRCIFWTYVMTPIQIKILYVCFNWVWEFLALAVCTMFIPKCSINLIASWHLLFSLIALKLFRWELNFKDYANIICAYNQRERGC